MVSDGEKKKIMSLNNGMCIETYEDLIQTDHLVFYHEAETNRNYSFSHEFGVPGMINVETGTRYFGADIVAFIKFPLHRIRFVPHTQEEMGAP